LIIFEAYRDEGPAQYAGIILMLQRVIEDEA
jgi:hypothetical protein